MSLYDRWLTHRMEVRERDHAEFEAWCEKHDVDPEAPDSAQLFEDYKNEYIYDEYDEDDSDDDDYYDEESDDYED